MDDFSPLKFIKTRLRPSIRSLLENVPCSLEKALCCVVRAECRRDVRWAAVVASVQVFGLLAESALSSPLLRMLTSSFLSNRLLLSSVCQCLLHACFGALSLGPCLTVYLSAQPTLIVRYRYLSLVTLFLSGVCRI